MNCSTPCIDDVCIRKAVWDMTAQMSHTLAGSLVIVALVIIFRRWFKTRRIVLAILFMFMIYVFVKEFWYDPNYQTDMERGDDYVDAFTYLLGLLISLALVRLLELDWHQSTTARRPDAGNYRRTNDTVRLPL